MVTPSRLVFPFRGLRQRNFSQQAQPIMQVQVDITPKSRRAANILLRGPRILLYGPKLLFRAPRSVHRRLFASTAATTRQQVQDASQEIPNESFEKRGQSSSSSSDSSTSRGPRASFTSRLRERLRETPIKWSPIPISLGAAVIGALTLYKSRPWELVEEDEGKGKHPARDDEIKISGPWQVHVMGALPLRSMSRLYGLANSYTLPVWLRTPGYKLYSMIFGVHLEECDPSDLREYRSMSEFFMRRLKPGLRPIADVQLVSPADGRIVNFGVIEDGRIEQIKGKSYSLKALLSGIGKVDNSLDSSFKGHTPHPHQAEGMKVDEREFANMNGIQYSLDELIGDNTHGKGINDPSVEDASMSPAELEKHRPDVPRRTLSGDAAVAKEVAFVGSSEGHQVRPGNKLFYSVIYLAPGDYHRYHSPTSWVVEKRRHFAGELFSVSPWMTRKLPDLFVLNERVALLGRWRHGFFSMIPVGATNVGSIRVNFDSKLRTNSPLRPITPGTYSEATYTNASALLNGQPLRSGDEVGGFWLGSTIVLVFEAPEKFEWNIEVGQKVKVGEALGDFK